MTAPATIRVALQQSIEAVWEERWGLPVVTRRDQYQPGDVEGLELVSPGGDLLGLVTWAWHGELADVVSLDALQPGQGHGSRLLEAAEEELRRQGARQLVLTTTNDNLGALCFYLRRGYRLVHVERDGMDRVRAIKPGVGKIGESGIPLRDMWELEKELAGGAAAEPPAGQRLARQAIGSGSPFEGQIGCSRAVRVGDHVFVSGTAPIGPQGRTVGLGDVHAQTRRCFEVIAAALAEAGCTLQHVVRTRILLTDMNGWREAASVHEELFGGIRPACTFVQVARFIDPGWLVEVEVDAVREV